MTRPTPINRRRALALALGGSLAGCASVPSPGRPQPLPAPAARPDALWRGRLSVQVAATAGSGRAQGGQAGFELRGTAQAGTLTLISPLGTLLARARWDAAGVELEQPGEAPRRFDDLPAMSAELLGEPLPLQALFDWLQGRPFAGMASEPTVDGFSQLGWQVDTRRLGDGHLRADRAAQGAQGAATLRVRLDAEPAEPPPPGGPTHG